MSPRVDRIGQTRRTLALIWLILGPHAGDPPNQLAAAMMFRSYAAGGCGDTWGIWDPAAQRYFAYALVTETGPGSGFVAASSADGIHWFDHGYVFHKPGERGGPSCSNSTRPCAGWMGSGHIWRATNSSSIGQGKYITSFSQCPGNHQEISFATSDDMLSWNWLDHDWFLTDERYYLYGEPGPGGAAAGRHLSRWDGMSAILPEPMSGEVAYAVWTASPKGPPAPWGLGTSTDGITWTALPPPALDPAESGEIGGIALIPVGATGRSKFFAIINSYKYGGTVVYSASNVTGPYLANTTGPNFRLVAGRAYYARFLAGKDGEILISHQHNAGMQLQTKMYSDKYAFSYIGTYKRAMVDSTGTLRAMWWAENNRLKSHELRVAVDRAANAVQGALTLTPSLPDSPSPPPQPASSVGVDIRAGILLEANLSWGFESVGPGIGLTIGSAGPAPAQSGGTCNGGVNHTLCGCVVDGKRLLLTCPGAGTIARVVFASIGTPTGGCGDMAVGKCAGKQALATKYVNDTCMGKHGCSLDASINTFNGWSDPCYNVVKSVAVAVECTTAFPPPPPPPPKLLWGVSILLDKNGVSRLGEFDQVTSAFTTKETVDRGLQATPPKMLRVLVRGSMLESYVDDALMHVWTTSADDNGGHFPHDIWASGQVAIAPSNSTSIGASNIRAWQMNLLGSGVALGRKTNASSNKASAGPELAVDGSPFTLWEAAPQQSLTNQTLDVDLGMSSSISWFQISWGSEASFAASYEIAVDGCAVYSNCTQIVQNLIAQWHTKS
jgi:hypothetical protein